MDDFAQVRQAPAESPSPMPPARGAERKNSVRFLLLVVLAVLFIGAGKIFLRNQEGFRQLCESLLSPLPAGLSGALFVILYVTLSFFVWLGPKDIFKIAGALIYGPYLSTLLIYIAEMFNAVLLFSLSRRLGRGFVAARMPGRMQRIDNAVSGTGFLSIFFLRFFPVVPFRFLDLGFGLTGISLKKYLLIAALGSPLRIFFVQLYLSLGLDTVMDQERLSVYLAAHPRVMGFSFLYVVGSIVLAIVLRKRMRRRET